MSSVRTGRRTGPRWPRCWPSYAGPLRSSRPTPRTDLTLPGRESLEQALDDLDREWTGGPYSEPARRLLASRADHVRRLLGESDLLAEQMRNTASAWVVTHGEPHPGNVLRTAAGLRLVAWDTVQIAPPERDLWLVVGDTADKADDWLAGYVRATAHQISPAGLALYRLWWELADIAGFVDELRRPHIATADTAASWMYLQRYLE